MHEDNQDTLLDKLKAAPRDLLFSGKQGPADDLRQEQPVNVVQA